MSSVAAVVARSSSRVRTALLNRSAPSVQQCVSIRSYVQEREIITPPEPGHKLETIQLPPPDVSPKRDMPEDPAHYHRKPVTSAHAIDTTQGKLSARDSAAISPTGSVIHGRYGDLGPEVAQSIPLEYLALLYPAAQGAAALRALTEKNGGAKGTLLVYGASQPNAMASVQLASTAGNAVVAVVGGEHSGNEEMMAAIKGLASEPGTAVTQEYAMLKKNFADLVKSTMEGDDAKLTEGYNPDQFLTDFKENLLAYAAKYPSTLPAAVDKSHLDFQYGDKEREHFRDNMDAYLSQFPAGSHPFDPAKLDAYFDKDQYATFKAKFNKQTSAVVTGDEVGSFVPTDVVHSMLQTPKEEELDSNLKQEAVDDDIPFVPYEFSVLDQKFGQGVESKKGGPLMGAIIAVTPTLAEAATVISKAQSLRSKAEALQFLTASERTALSAATSVANIAKEHGVPVYTVGGKLPGFESVEPTDDDVQEALAGMELDENGTSRINYFVQVYRAGDFPMYADYAVHRASEELAGPRQFVVTK